MARRAALHDSLVFTRITYIVFVHTSHAWLGAVITYHPSAVRWEEVPIDGKRFSSGGQGAATAAQRVSSGGGGTAGARAQRFSSGGWAAAATA